MKQSGGRKVPRSASVYRSMPKRGAAGVTKLNIFQKIVLLLLILLIPILLLFHYTNQVSVGVIREEMESSINSRLSFFANQMNDRINLLSLLAVMSGRDTTIRQYQSNYLSSGILSLDRQKTKAAAEDMLLLQSVSAGWTNTLRIFSPSLGEFIGSDFSGPFEVEQLQDELSTDWTERRDGERVTFVRHVVEPYAYRGDLHRANTIVEISFPDDNIRRMLDEFKSQDENDPFLYRSGEAPIVNATADRETIEKLVGRLDALALPRSGSVTEVLQGMTYLVAFEKLEDMDWYAVDYVPLQQILTPITKSRNLFYAAAASLLAMAIAMAVVLYRNVQVPIRRLTRALQLLKRGDFSVRLTVRPRNEFGFVFDRFNEMASQINTLITNVYEEKLRSREATLKQLQSQINPHFLYNCLAFITSMAKLKDTDAVIAMGLNLGQYYRYATRVESQLVPLSAELDVVENYLKIQSMRNQRLQYEIEVSDEVREGLVPRLLLQPIVENAIVHGIEPKPGVGWIRIFGTLEDGSIRLAVDDNGKGMSEDELLELEAKLRQPLREDVGCGVWNVRQRLMYQFGEQAELTFIRKPEGGLRVELSWPFEGVHPNHQGGAAE